MLWVSLPTLVFILMSFVWHRLEAYFSVISVWLSGIVYYDFIETDKLHPNKRPSKKKALIAGQSLTLVAVETQNDSLKKHPRHDSVNLILRVFFSFCLSALVAAIVSLLAPHLPDLVNHRFDFTLGITAIIFFLCCLYLWLDVWISTSDLKISIVYWVFSGFVCFFFISVLPRQVLEFDPHDLYVDLGKFVNHQLQTRFDIVLDETILSKPQFLCLLSAFAGFLSGITVVPTLRFVRCHLSFYSDTLIVSVLGMSSLLLLPLISLSYASPLLISYFSPSANVTKAMNSFAWARFGLVLLYTVCRFLQLRGHISAFLHRGREEWARVNRIPNVTIDALSAAVKRVFLQYILVCDVALELLCPVILLFIAHWTEFIVKFTPLFGDLTSDPIFSFFGSRIIIEVMSFVTWWLSSVMAVTTFLCAIGEIRIQKEALKKSK